MPPEATAEPQANLTPLRSVHTVGFPRLLERLGVSVLVTTYQAGKLVVLRAEGDALNTHFRSFCKPMGLAVAGDRFAIGTAGEVWEYHNVPAVARRLEPHAKHDACFVPRRGHCTGDVQIHEMAWGFPSALAPPGRRVGEEGEEPELWFVNTRFSCLCTLDRVHSFVPRWQPPFITELAPEDRCHLNGLAMVEGRPAFVTALGETDTNGGWRVHKKDGGLLMEVETGAVVRRGLSMPHSPRWHDGKLWVLESGTGCIGCVAPRSQRYERVAELPGFTRGLDFAGDLAFVGLSQVRESAVFSGIPIAERPLAERCCGVWVLDVTSGKTVAYVKFEDAVQEVFALQVLPGVRFPDVLNDNNPLLADSFVLPDRVRAQVPEALRASPRARAELGLRSAP